ncbi:MAG: hypothetical protein J5497_07210, partial [Selenomonadaceae bacterium]|nr:hypothetical protein [Selenomonadaceae bacterium]
MFILLVSAILGGIMALALFSIRFIFSEHLAKKFYRLFAIADLAIIGVMIIGWAIRSFVPSWFVSVFGNVATIFIMTQLICAVMVMVAFVVRLVYRKLNPPKKFDPARRRILTYGMLYPVMSLAISLYGNRIEKNCDVENFYDVPIKNLPSELQ